MSGGDPGPKFSQVLRAYAEGLTRPWDSRWDGMQPGECRGFTSTPEDQIAEKQARSTRAAFESLAALYEKTEEAAPTRDEYNAHAHQSRYP